MLRENFGNEDNDNPDYDKKKLSRLKSVVPQESLILLNIKINFQLRLHNKQKLISSNEVTTII